jgi:K+-sensing histidine kinase KdpD
MTTAFAPAERSSDNEIKAQFRIFSDDKRLCAILDLIPDFTLILNQNRQIVFANKSLVEFLGNKPLEEILGKRPGELFECVHSGESPAGCGTTEFCKVCGAVNAILNCQNNYLRDIKECEIQSISGKAFNFRVWASPIDKNGSIYTLFTVRDIADEKYRSALEHIFFHDITNTGSGIYGLLAMIEENPELYQEYSDTLTRLSKELLDEISAQRDILQAERGEIAVNREYVMSMDILNDVLDLYRNHRVSQDKKLEIADNSEAVSFISDSRLIRRVIGNMTKNALEASKCGEKVLISCRRCEKGVVFEVHNNVFIEPDVQLSIFIRSFSTKGKGRGWGTYSMKLLSENYLEGKVYFTSDITRGTSFFAKYPMNLSEDK